MKKYKLAIFMVLLLFAFSAYADQFDLIISEKLGDASIDCVRYSPNGQLLAVAQGNFINFYSAKNFKIRGSIVVKETDVVSMAFFSNEILVSAYDDRKVRVWNISSKSQVLSPISTGSSPTSVACSRSGIIAVGLEVYDKNDDAVKLYKLNDSLTSYQELPSLKGHGYPVKSVAFSSGNLLASASEDPEIRLWKWDSGTGSYQEKEPPSPIVGDNSEDDDFLSLAFSHLGDRLASGSSGQSYIKIWNHDTGENLETLNDFNFNVSTVAFSMDGNYLAGGSWGQVKLFNAQSYEEISEVSPSLPGCSEREIVNSISFSPNSTQLAAGTSDGYILVWYLEKRGIPKIAVTPTEIDFGEVIVGNSASQELQVLNTGGETLRVTGIQNADPEQPIPPEISISGDINFIVLANSKLPHYGPTIIFTPIDDGELECELSIISNARNLPPIIKIQATGKYPAPTIEKIEPVSGTISGGTPVTIRGTNFRDGATVTFGGNPADDVTVVSPNKITATTPAGDQEGKVDVVVTNSDNQLATLTDGFEYTTEAVIVVSPSSIDFGNVEVGQSSTVSLTIRNEGSAALTTLEDITTSNAAFSVSPVNINVAPGGSTQIDATFTPPSEEPFVADLTIISNAINAPELVVPLKGIGGGGIVCKITFPEDDSLVNKTVDITGKADVTTTATFSEWQLFYAPGNQRPEIDVVRLQAGAWTYIDSGRDPIEGYLASWDTTKIDDGLYTLRLRVISKNPDETKDYLILVTVDNTPPKIYNLVMESAPGGEEFTTDNAEITVSVLVSADTTEIVSIIFEDGDPRDVSTEISLDGRFIEGSFNAGVMTSDRASLELEVRDEVGNIARGYNDLIVDNTPPTVKIQHPCYYIDPINLTEYYSNFRKVPIPIAGIAEDDTSGISRVEISFECNTTEPGQREWYQVSGSSDWSWGFSPINFNDYCELKVKAYDLLGNVSEVVTAKVSYYDYRPDIHIWNPIDNLYLSDFIDIEGNASQGYKLEYRRLDSANWNTIYESSQAGYGDYFTRTWDARALNGIYQLRLTVGNKQVYRNNLHISSPDSLGDVNLDDSIDLLDAQAVLEWVVGKRVGTFAESLADVSCDGKITAYDAALIFQKAAGLINKFPCEQ